MSAAAASDAMAGSTGAATMARLTYSRGKNLKDNRPVQCSAAEVGEFIEQLNAGRAPLKEGAAYVCGPLGGDGRRCADNALPRTWVAVDLDGIEAPTLPDVIRWAERYEGCWWHTHSSTPEAPRMRIVFVLARPADRDECIALGVELEGEALGMFGAAVKWDRCTFRPEQAVLVPPPGAHVNRMHGALLPVPAAQAAGRTKDRGAAAVAQKTGDEAGCTEEDAAEVDLHRRGRKVLKPSSVSSVSSVHAGAAVVAGVVWPIPPDTIPTEAGQRNDWLFRLARHVKAIQPPPTPDELRGIVRAWHDLALPAIQTTDFAASLGEFRHAYEQVKYPHGATMDAIIASIDTTAPLPAGIDRLGYGEAANQLVRVCAALQAHFGSDPFFLSAREAEKLVGTPYRDANRMMQAFVQDGVLEVVKKGAGMKASRYRFVWDDTASGNSSSAPMVAAPAAPSSAGTAPAAWKIPADWQNAA